MMESRGERAEGSMANRDNNLLMRREELFVAR
jgi:hypothetical protein